MLLKISNANFKNYMPQRGSLTTMKGRYTGIPNFHPRHVLNPKQSFFTKMVKFVKALYYTNFK